MASALVIRSCPVCSTEYEADPQRLKHGRQTTCSRDCSYALRAQKSSVAFMGVRRSPATEFQPGANTRSAPYLTIPCQVCEAPIDIKYERQETRTKFCSKACFYKGRALPTAFQPGHASMGRGPRGGKHSDETRKRISEICRAKAKRGADNPLWTGGTDERSEAMGRWEYKDWRKAVFVRDNYTCTSCGVRGGALHADHVLSWAENPELRYDVSNGRTLCIPCHYEVTFGKAMPEGSRWCGFTLRTGEGHGD